MNRLDFIKHNISRLKDPKDVEEEKRITSILNNSLPYGGMSNNQSISIISYCIKHQKEYKVNIEIRNQEVFCFIIGKKSAGLTQTFALLKDIFEAERHGRYPDFTTFLSAQERLEIDSIRQEIIKQGLNI